MNLLITLDNCHPQLYGQIINACTPHFNFPILFQEGHLLRNSIAIFALTTLFYFIGAELRLVHELSLFWPLNGVMAGVFARYVWLNRLHYYAISYVAMLVYDAITTEWGLVSLVINFSNMMFIVTVALLVVRDKRLGKNKYEPVRPYGYLITV